MADKVANTDERTIDALDCGPSYYQAGEKSVGQKRAEELNRGFFYFSNHCLKAYTDNGDLIGSWIGHGQGDGRWIFSVNQPTAQRNVTAAMEILPHQEKLLKRSSTNATGSAFGNGGRP